MRRLLPLAAAASTALAAPTIALADDPVDPRCADQGAAPAGIDMSLVCTTNEVVGAYTGRRGAVQAAGAPDGSALAAGAVAVLALGGLVVAAFAVVRGRAGRRLEPAVPYEWWACPACRSLNAGSTPRCYACQAARPSGAEPDADVLRRET